MPWKHQLNSEQLLPPLFTILHLGPMPHKLMVSPQVKKTPLPLPASWISSVVQLPLLPLALFILSLGLQFHQVFSSELLVLHSKDVNEVILLQVSLEIEALCYCTLYSAYSKVHKSTATCRECMHMTMYIRHGLLRLHCGHGYIHADTDSGLTGLSLKFSHEAGVTI